MKIKDFMSSNVFTCHENQTVEEAAKMMIEKGISTVPIVNDGQSLVGILTESDFVGKKANIPHALVSIKQLFGQLFHFSEIESIYKDAKKKQLSEVMTKNPTTVEVESDLTEVVNLMMSKGLKRMPVIDGDKLVGFITRKDLLKAFIAT